ncbi:MAG TPA: hypothetical protein VH394_20350 [Thermoanaerobaculia bacterium]|jgi:hypothetical protein|nr:hypothetical protein [Thermoanaerobaculia bacterium]
MMRATKILLLFVLTIALPLSAARLKPTSDLLLPRFEIDSVVTTVFSVGNASDKPIEVLATVTTSQGLPARELPFTLQAGEVRTVDLREWLTGDSGDSVVGSLTLRTRSGRRDALWGDWSVTDAGGTVLRGGTLVDIDRSGSHSDLCRRHLLRYDEGTEILVWRENAGLLEASLSEQDGTQRIGLPRIEETLAVADLGLSETAGTLRIDTTEDVYIAGAWCVADACESERTALDVNILLDGRIADEPRGPLVDSGSALTWTLVVSNTGELAVNGIQIEGLDAACPRQELEAGESMECTADDVALSNPQSVPVRVTGRSTCADVSAKTTGYYEGVLVDVYP